MKTEKTNLSEIESLHPCSRLVNGFRICPFYSWSNKLFWVIKPNRSDYHFVFSSLNQAENFAKSHRNIHTSKYWFNLYNPLYHAISVVSYYDGLSVTSALADELYCRFIYNAISNSVRCL